MKNNNFAEIVFGRRSIRFFDGTVKISRQEMLEMIDKAVTAPSSVNMQPWRFIVVDSAEGKEKLSPLVRSNQLQNKTSAAMVVVFGDLACYEYGEKIYNKAVAQGKMSADVRDKQLASILPFYQNMGKEEMTSIVKIDASLAAMQFMLVARSYGYDTNAIGGFKADQLAEVFELDEQRYVPVMIIAVGKAKEVGYDSVRLDAHQITDFK
ncbi:nitroreductase family protein [Streptococcus dentapri]|uniref:Nitroreductase family protein n=1 Tax=Streptococcus dentapri TaxID=573564 RepID=A0ABV8D317_9STRE